MLLFQIPIYAAFLYDAVMVYARALDAVIRDNGTDLVKNGREISKRIFGTTYKSKLNKWRLVDSCRYHSV